MESPCSKETGKDLAVSCIWIHSVGGLTKNPEAALASVRQVTLAGMETPGSRVWTDLSKQGINAPFGKVGLASLLEGVKTLL